MSGQRLAVVVAVDGYDDEELGRLDAPAADAEALGTVLGDPALGGFDVSVVRNATDSTIKKRIEDLFADRTRDDLVLLHFSCHGIKDRNGDLMLAAKNTNSRRLASTSVEAEWVSRQILRTRAGRVVLLLDCCFGGAFERGMVPRSAGDVDVVDQFTSGRPEQGRGLAIITASTASEYAFEGPRLVDAQAHAPSIFTGAVVEGIRTGDADRDHDGHISLGELYDYVYERVREQTPHQTPSKWELGIRGGLYIARNPSRAHPGGMLSSGLLSLITHTEPAGRIAAVDELAQLTTQDGAIAAEARRALDLLGNDPNPRVATAAGQALNKFRPPTQQVSDAATPARPYQPDANATPAVGQADTVERRPLRDNSHEQDQPTEQQLAAELHKTMVDGYRRAKIELGYNANYFLRLVSEHGGLGAARKLLHAQEQSTGFTTLWEKGRLDLSVEAVVLRTKFAPLFTHEELTIARDRLAKFGYVPPEPTTAEPGSHVNPLAHTLPPHHDAADLSPDITAPPTRGAEDFWIGPTEPPGP